MTEQPTTVEGWSNELDVIEDENYRPDPSFQTETPEETE